MTESMGDFYDALRAAVAVTLPEVVLDGIWEGEQAALVPWADMVPPFVAFVTPMEPGTPWTLDSDMHQFGMDIYYLGEVRGSSKPVLAKLEALKVYLLANDLGTGRILDIGLPSCSRSLPPNEAMVQKGATQRVGRLPLVCLL